MIVLCVLCVYHDLIVNLAFIVNPFEFNPSAVVRPFSIWMLYFAIVDRRPWRWIVLGMIVAGISIKNAWMPWLMCLLLFTGRFSLRVERIIYGVAAIAALIFLLVGHALLAQADGSWALLWEALRAREGMEGDPFLNLSREHAVGGFVFLAIAAVCLRVRLHDQAVEAKVHRLAALTLLVFVLGGIYYNWVPSSLRIPQIIPFAPTRGLFLPQVLFYAAIGASILSPDNRFGVLERCATMTSSDGDGASLEIRSCAV